jgi:acid phosphatase (class A)
MSRRAPALVAAFAVALFASFSLAQDGQPPLNGYLGGDTPDGVRLLPPPPPPGSGREADDEAIFKATRGLEGGPRWAVATSDVNLRQGPGVFACALGLTLDAENAPKLTRLFFRVAADSHNVIEAPKNHYGRPRPYAGSPAAPTCEPKTEGLTSNPSYPSGHAAIGWAWGLILAELAPDRATDITMRARAFGESRIVCGVHYLSDVQAGRDAAAMLIAAEHGNPEFRADMDTARAELRTLRETPHVGPEGCLDFDQASAHTPY